jgi:hypothetical protein
MKLFGCVNVVTLVARLPICGVFLNFLVIGNLQATEWQEVSRNVNLAIYIRHRSHSPIEEVRGIAEFNAPILVLKGVLADVAKYSEFMPYTKESRVLPQDAQLCYGKWCLHQGPLVTLHELELYSPALQPAAALATCSTAERPAGAHVILSCRA